MAEGYLARRLKDIGREDIRVISAGTSAIDGLSPSQEAIQVMKEHGIDISGYRSSQLSKERIEKADIILTMEERHNDAILQIDPSSTQKIRLLRSFSQKQKDENNIKDPIGMPVEFYREALTIIKDSVEGFLVWLQK